MKISIVGLGYLGVTHAVAMAKLGHQVVGVDVDSNRVESLRAGRMPFFEPGLAEALGEMLASGSIRFENSHGDHSRDCDVHFLCVGTPQSQDGSANTNYLFAAVSDLAPVLGAGSLVVGKSTVPVGTAARLRERLAELTDFAPKLVWNPEFLREGTALQDSLKPDRIVIGAFDSADAAPLIEAYRPLLAAGSPVLEMDVATAELVKVAANSFLATKVSFINAMAEVAERSGADVVRLAEALGHDPRIGNQFMRSGIGFGGGCLPKDIRGFVARATELGAGEAVAFLNEVDQVNLRRRSRVVELAQAELGEVAGKKITVLGVAFKPDSDDVRDSPALEIARSLARLGARVTVTDPVALHGLADAHLIAEPDVTRALGGAELVILGTEWREYLALDPVAVGSLVSTKTIIDGRNVLDVASWQRAGFRLIALGRSVHLG
jgi:UDPglucose 6-dehydrogenase